MNVDQILTEIDSEIAKLLEVRSTLLALETPGSNEPRPEGKAGTVEPKKRRKMSAEGRANMAAAQKKRWAAKNRKA